MKIIRTDTINHTRKIINLKEFCNIFFGINCGKALKIWANCRLLNNEVFTDREYEFKKSI